MKTKFYLLVLCCSMIATATVWSQKPFTLSEDGTTLTKWTGLEAHVDMPTVALTYPELDAVTTIAADAFAGNTTMTHLTISKNVSDIWPYLFNGPDNIQSISVHSGNIHYKAVDGVLFNFEGTHLAYYPRAKAGTTYTIPADVTMIWGGLGFYRNMNLTKIILPATGFQIMMDHAFWGATALKTIDNLDKIEGTSIPSAAFSDCWSLESITLPANITTIGEKAFFNLRDITEITSLNTTPPTLGNNVFAWDSWLNEHMLTQTRTVYVPSAAAKTAYEGSDWGTIFGHDNIQEIIATSIGELNNQSDMAIWVKDNKFQVKDNEYGSELSFNIFNSTGQLVQSLSNLSESIDQNLKGLYIVNVKRAGEAIKSFKIIL